MRNRETETLSDYAARLRRELGQTASQQAINSYRDKKTVVGMLSMSQIIDALEAATGAPGVRPVLVATPVAQSPVAKSPAPTIEPELHGIDLVRASIRKGLKNSSAAYVPSKFSDRMKQTVHVSSQSSPGKPELFGRARVQASIRANLVKNGLDRNLSVVE